MLIEEIYEKLTEIFRENFDDDTIVLSPATTAEDIEDWDSLEQINLIAGIENKFAVTFDIKETLTLQNVGEMAKLILSKLQAHRK